MSKLVSYVDDDVLQLADQVLEHYFDQRGGAIPDVFVEYDQAGQGWGNVLKGLVRFFRPVVPLLAQGARTIGKQALASAGGLLGDVVSGQDWREAGEQRLGEAHSALAKKFQDKMSRMAGAGLIGGQFGGGPAGRHKSIHHAVKLFSFSPPTGVKGCATGRVTKRRKSKPKQRRARQSSSELTSSGSFRVGGVRRRRRKPSGKRAAPRRRAPKKRKRGAVKGRRRKVAGGARRRRGATTTRRRRRVNVQQQHGSGFDGGGGWF